MENGLIQVYTGDGKGKTTAAVGLCVRAVSHSLKVAFISFHKEWSGEMEVLKGIGVEVYTFARAHPSHNACNIKSIKKECRAGIEKAKAIFSKADIVVLDEIGISLRDGFLKEEEVIGLINAKPSSVELILTGRGIPHSIIEKADLVTGMRKIKHPYDRGVKQRIGIEL
jgi:cob(I)alamin adenosyltransferase